MKYIKPNREIFIFACCKEWQRPFFQILKNNSDQIWEWASHPEELNVLLRIIQPRYIFFSHWNWFVPDKIWKTYECVCFHMTDLPYGRGGSPLQNLIINRHKNTKLTALRMNEELDGGPIYTKKDLGLDGSAQNIYLNAAQLTIDMIEWIVVDNPTPIQQEGKAIFFKRRNPGQSVLPTSNQEIDIFDFIRMLDADGYPHAFIEHGDFRLEFREVKKQGEALIAEVRITSKTDGDIK